MIGPNSSLCHFLLVTFAIMAIIPQLLSSTDSSPSSLLLGTEESYTCSNADPSLSTWENIKSIFAYDQKMALLVSFYLENPESSQTIDNGANNQSVKPHWNHSDSQHTKQVYEIRFVLLHDHQTHPVYAIDLMQMELVVKYSDHNSFLYHKHLEHPMWNVRYFSYLNENLLVVVVDKQHSDKESLMVYNIRNDSIVSMVDRSKQFSYIPIYHFQFSSNQSNHNNTKPDPTEFPMSIIKIHEFSIQYGLFNTKPKPQFTALRTKYYFGFHRKMKKIYLAKKRSDLNLDTIPDYLEPAMIFPESGSWHAFLYYQHIYLLTGQWVLYFKDYKFDEIKPTRSKGGVQYLAIPLAVMHNNTMFRCGGVSADISGSGSELKLIPKFPPDIDALRDLISLLYLIGGFLTIAVLLIAIVWITINKQTTNKPTNFKSSSSSTTSSPSIPSSKSTTMINTCVKLSCKSPLTNSRSLSGAPLKIIAYNEGRPHVKSLSIPQYIVKTTITFEKSSKSKSFQNQSNSNQC